MPKGFRLADYAGTTVMAIGAHPDDLEVAVGGTLASLSNAGADVQLVVACVPNSLEVRKAEAADAAEILGGTLRILYPDREMHVEDAKTYELAARIELLIRELRPAAVLTHSLADFHKDHILVHHACLAIQESAFFDHLCFHPVSSYPLNMPFAPQVLIDISDTIGRKLDAIEAHRSQFGSKGFSAGPFEKLAKTYGRLAGARYAEPLQVLRIRLN
jgi:LmbE family N-acetylglucosaminyl deacetylase